MSLHRSVVLAEASKNKVARTQGAGVSVQAAASFLGAESDVVEPPATRYFFWTQGLFQLKRSYANFPSITSCSPDPELVGPLQVEEEEEEAGCVSKRQHEAVSFWVLVIFLSYGTGSSGFPRKRRWEQRRSPRYRIWIFFEGLLSPALSSPLALLALLESSIQEKLGHRNEEVPQPTLALSICLYTCMYACMHGCM